MAPPSINSVATLPQQHNGVMADGARLESFDTVRGTVLRLVELQRMLVDPANSDPVRQKQIGEEMWQVREELARQTHAQASPSARHT